MIRLLFWLLLAPFRAIRWVFRRAYVLLVGYDALRLELRGPLGDRPAPGGLRALLGEPPEAALLPTLAMLDRARRDDRLKVVLVELGPLSCGLARAEEVADALRRVREAGKRVVIVAEQLGLTEYVAALGGSELVVAPSGGLDVTGVASEIVFLKGLLDKVGVRTQLVARGKYKSARETFAEPEMTEPNREMTEALVGDLFSGLVARIAEARSLTEDAVRAALDDGPFLAPRAVELGLLDRTEYADETTERLEAELPRFRVLDVRAYRNLSGHVARRGRPTRVALLEVGGPIKSGRTTPGRSGPQATGSRTFVDQVEKVAKNPRIKAVLLRVDSPGGSALASDLMWHALGKLEDKPLVVSMANVAASGGYFVAGVKGATVVASDSTVTGSIGVLGGKFDARALYDKLGVKKEIIRRGAHAGQTSDYRPLSDEELQKLESDIDTHYKDFVTKMAEGRSRSFDEIHEVAQGRVWTGRQARDIGLVDEKGGLGRALECVRERLGLEAGAPLAIVTPPGPSRRMGIRALLSGAVAALAPRSFSEGPLASWQLFELFGRERIFTLLPFDVRFR